MHNYVDGIHVWASDGKYDQGAFEQMRNVSYVGNVRGVALMADHHLGYWGTGPDGRGENKMGKILMEIRSTLTFFSTMSLQNESAR